MVESEPSLQYKSISELHKETFDKLASEYAKRFESRVRTELFLLGPMAMYLRDTFSEPEIHVLDVGCGAGGSCLLLEKQGFKTYGIDISPKMIQEAKRTAPMTEFLEGDYLGASFDAQIFHGVCAKAVLHLFDDSHASIFLEKTRSILIDDGAFFVAVAAGSNRCGSIAPKLGYPGQPKRFLRPWVLPELLNFLEESGFAPIYWAEQRGNDKSWIDCWCIKS